MAGVSINDLSSNPWVLAEVGEVKATNAKFTTLVHHEPDSSVHVAELVDSHGKIVARFDENSRQVDQLGWIRGLTVEKLDSGYILAYLASS